MVLDALLTVLYNLSVMVLVSVTVSELYRVHSHKKLAKLEADLHEKIKYERENRLDNDNLIEKLVSDLDGDVGDAFAILDEKLDKLKHFQHAIERLEEIKQAPVGSVTITTKAAKVSTAKSKKSATSKRKK